MSRLAILALGMVLGGAAVGLIFSFWLDPDFLRANSRLQSTMSPGELVVAPVAPAPVRPPQPATYPDAQVPAPAPVERGLSSKPIAEPISPLPASTAPLAPGSALLVPVSGIAPAQLSDTFTQSRGQGRLHDAIDIMAPRGTPVVAVADGRIAKLFTSKPGGLTAYQFDVEEKLAYYYAHLDSYAPTLVEGQQVRRGDVIGYVGFTGNASPDGPHLHFAVFILGPDKKWWQGTPINPYPLLGGG